MPAAKRAVNEQWFNALLASKKFSKRKFSKLLGKHPSMLTRVLNGERRATLEEASQIASILDVSYDEVITNFGIKLPNTRDERNVKIKGYVNSDLEVVLEPPKGAKIVVSPFNAKDVSVLRCQTAGSPFETLDGALIFYSERGKGISLDALNKPCVVRVASNSKYSSSKRDKGERMLFGVLRRGYEPGAYCLTGFDGQSIKDDISLDAAHPVLWFKF